MSVWLTAQQASAYAHLTTEALALSLPTIRVPDSGGEHSVGLCAAASSFAGLPAALAVIQLSSGRVLDVLSLVVAEPFRVLGLATQLCDWLRCEAKRLGLHALMISFPLDHLFTGAMERLTDPGQGWSHSPGLRLVHLNRDGLQGLMDRMSPLVDQWGRSDRFQTLSWRDLNPKQLDQLQGVRDAPHWAQFDSGDPGAVLGHLDEAVSQVLLERESPVGWLLAHHVGVSRIRVSVWWIQPYLQGQGIALMLLRPAIAHALARKPAYESSSFGIAASSGSMLRLSKRHLETFAYQVQANKRASLLIN